MASIRRSPAERAAAWTVTGPPGHLWGASADIVTLWVRWLLARARGRGLAG